MISNKWASKSLKRLSLYLALIYFAVSLTTSLYFVDDFSSLLNIKRYVFSFLVSVGFYVIWYLIASVQSASFSYANSIKGSKEQPAILALAQGSLGLYISVILTAFINLFRVPYLGAQAYQYMTIGLFYLTAITAMYFFFYVGKAGYILAKYVKRQSQFSYIFLLFTAILVTFCMLAWQVMMKHTHDVLGVNQILDYLSPSVVLNTLLLPLILFWSYGLAGAYGFYAFLRYTDGVIYKHAFCCLAVGVVSLVVMSITRNLSDYFFGRTSQYSYHTEFGRIIILMLLAIGSLLLILLGLSRLLKIEKVAKQKK